jgi:hypothetical protein
MVSIVWTTGTSSVIAIILSAFIGEFCLFSRGLGARCTWAEPCSNVLKTALVKDIVQIWFDFAILAVGLDCLFQEPLGDFCHLDNMVLFEPRITNLKADRENTRNVHLF